MPARDEKRTVSSFARRRIAGSAVVTLLLACEPTPAPTATPSAPASPPVAVASASGSPTKATMSSKLKIMPPIAAGYGGMGPATPAPHPNVWFVVILDINVTAPLTGIEVEQIELLGPQSEIVARAAPPLSVLRDDRTVSDEARRRGDLSDRGTTPFDGAATPARDLRLRVHAPLDVRADSLQPRPVRFRIRLRATDDPGATIEGTLRGPWPTG